MVSQNATYPDLSIADNLSIVDDIQPVRAVNVVI